MIPKFLGLDKGIGRIQYKDDCCDFLESHLSIVLTRAFGVNKDLNPLSRFHHLGRVG